MSLATIQFTLKSGGAVPVICDRVDAEDFLRDWTEVMERKREDNLPRVIRRAHFRCTPDTADFAFLTSEVVGVAVAEVTLPGVGQKVYPRTPAPETPRPWAQGAPPLPRS